MAPAWKSLVWDIKKKKLLTLSAADIFQVAESLGPEAVTSRFDLVHISSFLNSKHSLELEDSGMSELLRLNDVIEKNVVNHDMLLLSGGTDVVDPLNTQAGGTIDQMSQANGSTGPPGASSTEQILTTYGELGKKIQSMMLPTAQSQSQPPPLTHQTSTHMTCPLPNLSVSGWFP